MAIERSIAETRNQLTRLLRTVESGERVKITRRGRPIAVLVPVETYERCCEGGPLLSFYEKWRAEHGGLSDGEVDEFVRLARSASPVREDFRWEE